MASWMLRVSPAEFSGADDDDVTILPDPSVDADDRYERGERGAVDLPASVGLVGTSMERVIVLATLSVFAALVLARTRERPGAEVDEVPAVPDTVEP